MSAELIGQDAGLEAARALAGRLDIDPAAPMTSEQAEQFRERFGAVMREIQEDPAAHPLRILPRPLTDDEVRQVLRSAVTVVKPGELLVLRIGAEWDMTPNQLREYNDALRSWAQSMAPGVEIMVVWASDGQITRQDAEDSQ